MCIMYSRSMIVIRLSNSKAHALFRAVYHWEIPTLSYFLKKRPAFLKRTFFNRNFLQNDFTGMLLPVFYTMSNEQMTA